MIRSRLAGAALVGACSVLCAQSVDAQSPSTMRPAPGLATADRVTPARYIACFDSRSYDVAPMRDAILRRAAGEAQRLAARYVERSGADRADFVGALERLGGRVRQHYWLIDAASIEVPAGTTQAVLEGLPGVVGTYADTARRPGHATVARIAATAPIRTATNARNHAADVAHTAGHRGAGVTVAVLDSSFDETVGTLGRPHRVFYPDGQVTNTSGGGIGNSRLLANVAVGLEPADSLLDHGTRVAAIAVGGTWSNPLGDNGHAPHSGIVGYAIADDPNAIAFLSTMVAAWQRCALDAAQYGTKVANLSYEGTDNVLSPEQQAMDAAVDIADLFVSTLAGNDPGSSAFSPAAVNVLAGGSVTNDTRVLSFFSPQRRTTTSAVFPHFVANGEGIVLPGIDDETIITMGTGTSFSAPHAAGAAAIFRSIATTANAEETRAALLATSEDVTMQNPRAGFSIGYGYIRTDRAMDLALGSGRTLRGTVSPASSVWRATIPVSSGSDYSIALSWSQSVVGDPSVSRLDLSVRGAVLGPVTSTLLGTNHVIRTSGTADGSMTIEVTLQSLEVGAADQAFGVAIHAPNERGSITAYGGGCGRATARGRIVYETPGNATAFGNTLSSLPFAEPTSRTQMLYRSGTSTASYTAAALLMRHDEQVAVGSAAPWVEMQVDLGTTDLLPAGISPVFSLNRPGSMVTAISRRRVVLPPGPQPATATNEFAVVIPLDFPFHRTMDRTPSNGSAPYRSLLLDVRTFANSVGGPLTYPLDAFSGRSGDFVTVTAGTPTAPAGMVVQGAATFVGLSTERGVRAPTLAGTGTPRIASTYVLDMTGLPRSVPVGINFGVSRSSFAGLGLPLDLALLGAPECFLWSSVEGSVSQTSDPVGNARLMVPVPGLPALIGQQIFHQCVVPDASANPLGVALSNGLAVTVGR